MTSKKSKISKKTKPTVLCEQCGQNFSKVANLNTHIQKVHKGLRWRCHICQKYQVSKHSHVRHYQSKHNGEMPTNVDVNQRFASTVIDMPEKAKDARMQELSERVKIQSVLLKSLRKRLLATLKDNIHLKSSLEMDCEAEKDEYNSLIGGSDDTENSDLDESNTEKNDDANSGEENRDESDSDDDDCHKSTYYPDKHPVSIDSFADDPEAGGSGV